MVERGCRDSQLCLNEELQWWYHPTDRPHHMTCAVSRDRAKLLKGDIETFEAIKQKSCKLVASRSSTERKEEGELFNSVINLLLIATVNQIARRVGETSLW